MLKSVLKEVVSLSMSQLLNLSAYAQELGNDGGYTRGSHLYVACRSVCDRIQDF